MERAASISKPCLCDCACNWRPKLSKNSFIVLGRAHALNRQTGHMHKLHRHGTDTQHMQPLEADTHGKRQLGARPFYAINYYTAAGRWREYVADLGTREKLTRIPTNRFRKLAGRQALGNP